MTDARDVARGLTETQANYMRHCAVQPDWDDRLWVNVTEPRMMSYLVAHNCHSAVDWDLMILALSPVGLAVRAELLKETTHD